MMRRLLREVLPMPKLTLEVATTIVEYHMVRNRTAQRSHEKTWKRRHENIEYKVLL
jgi:hypothetical protein